MGAVSVKVGVAVATLVALMVAGLGLAHGQNCGHNDVARQMRSELPDVDEYSFVALPALPPPAGTYLQTSHYADPLHSGQALLFEYRPFTLYACSEVPGFTPTGSCLSPDKTVLRTVRHHGVVTRYTVGTKSTAEARQADRALFRKIKTYLDHAHFTTRPQWVTAYAERDLHARYGE